MWEAIDETELIDNIISIFHNITLARRPKRILSAHTILDRGPYKSVVTFHGVRVILNKNLTWVVIARAATTARTSSDLIMVENGNGVEFCGCFDGIVLRVLSYVALMADACGVERRSVRRRDTPSASFQRSTPMVIATWTTKLTPS